MMSARADLLFDRRESAEERDARVMQDVVRSLHEALTHATDGLRNIPVFLKEAFERQVWKHERLMAGGTRQPPISFSDFIHEPYPVGLGASYDVLRGFIRSDVELLALFDAAAQRNVGANQHSEGDNNVNSRPAGNAAQQGIRRLRKAAEGDVDPETGEVRQPPDGRAATLLGQVMAETISINKACIEMGWRPKTVTVVDTVDGTTDAAIKKAGPIETAMRAWRKMSMEDQEQFLEWASRNMKTVADSGRATR